MKTKLANVKYIGLPIPKGTESVNESIAVVSRPYALAVNNISTRVCFLLFQRRTEYHKYQATMVKCSCKPTRRSNALRRSSNRQHPTVTTFQLELEIALIRDDRKHA